MMVCIDNKSKYTDDFLLTNIGSPCHIILEINKKGGIKDYSSQEVWLPSV